MSAFSRRTYSALAEVVAKRTQVNVDLLFHRFNLEHKDPGSSALKRSIALVRAVEQGECTAGTVDEITVELLVEVAPAMEWSDDATDRLSISLAADGYVYAAGKIAPIIPLPIAEAIHSNRIDAVLALLGAEEARNHFGQAVSAFADAKFESANAQSRATIESSLKFAAAKAGLPADDPASAMQALVTAKVWDEKERAFAKATWGLLHTDGAHAGTSSKDASLFRLAAISLLVWNIGSKFGAPAT